MNNIPTEWRIYPTADLAEKCATYAAFYTLSTEACYGKYSCMSCYFHHIDLCLCTFAHLFELPKKGYISITQESHPELFI